MVERRRVTGVTLIELMVTIAIMALLLFTGLPFTSKWIYSARANDGKGKVLQGYGLAKALALRNSTAAQGATASAWLKLDGLNLYVCRGDPTVTAVANTCVANGAAVTWQAALLEHTTVAFDGATTATQTIAFDNTGLPRDAAGVARAAIAYVVTYRSESENGTLY